MDKRIGIAVVVAVLGTLFILQNTISKPASVPKEEAKTQSPDVAGVATNDTADAVTETPMNTQKKTYQKPPDMTIDTSKTYSATFHTTKGDMTVILYAKDTPVAVNNFVTLAKDAFYDNTVFHRIIKGFMIQGGDPEGTGRGGPGYRFNDEPVTKEYTRGTLAMANAGPNTNGSQFFIMHATYPLPKNYVIFGTIDQNDQESLKTLDAIAQTPVSDNGMGEMSQPSERVTVTSITVKEQ